MRLLLSWHGARFSVYSVDLSNDPSVPDCPAKEFIDHLPRASQISLVGVITEHVTNGPLYNEEKSREIDDGIYEFKSRQGARVLWFYLPGRRTILTHGFPKATKSELRKEVRRAKEIRTAVEELGL